MNSYELSRKFCDWAFENPDKIKPIHYAIYFFSIEHCNRLGWKDKFGLPSQMVMEAIGVKNWRTYSSGLNDLVDFGFFKMIEISKNQYSSNIIGIVKNTKAHTKAHTKALDKALSKHSTKHSTKHSQSIVSIDKQLNNEQVTIKQINKIDKIPSLDEFFFYAQSIPEFKNDFEQLKFSIQAKYETWVSDDWKDGHGIKIKNWKTKLKNTLPYLKKVNNGNTQQPTNNEERRRSYIERVLHGSNESIDSERSPFGKDDSAFDAVEIVES